jgi:exonuclease VII large subunit
MAQRALDQLHAKIPACGAHGIERRVNALREVTSRFERLHLAERFVGERARIRHQHAVLHRGGTRQLLTTRAILSVGSNELSGRTAARLASARLMLAPRVQSLRGVLDVRIQAAAARLGVTHGQLNGACYRALQRHKTECERASARLSLPRIYARWERERALLEDRRRILRASDPRRALERGYSLTYTTAGVLVRSIRDALPGQSITTHLVDGHIEATVHEIGKEKRDERDDDEQHV